MKFQSKASGKLLEGSVKYASLVNSLKDARSQLLALAVQHFAARQSSVCDVILKAVESQLPDDELVDVIAQHGLATHPSATDVGFSCLLGFAMMHECDEAAQYNALVESAAAFLATVEATSRAVLRGIGLKPSNVDSGTLSKFMTIVRKPPILEDGSPNKQWCAFAERCLQTFLVRWSDEVEDLAPQQLGDVVQALSNEVIEVSYFFTKSLLPGFIVCLASFTLAAGVKAWALL